MELLVIGGGGREHAIIRKTQGKPAVRHGLLRARQRRHLGRRHLLPGGQGHGY